MKIVVICWLHICVKFMLFNDRVITQNTPKCVENCSDDQ